MDYEVHEKYKKAGKIAADARNYGVSLVKTGICFLDVVNKIEDRIIRQGAGLAFPVNIAVNHVAAHFSPRNDDTSFVFKKGDVVKIDVGSHIDGYIADTAVTVEVETDKYSDMIKASSDALDSAIKQVSNNAEVSFIGKTIQENIESFGFKPVNNLTGHSLEQYRLHSGISIPNVSEVFNKKKIKTDDVLAIEPFATNGAGHVVSGPGSNIYICEKSMKSRFVRDTRTKIYYKKIQTSFKTLPFAQRWVEKLFQNNDPIIRRLTYMGLLKHFPQLIEADDGIVTQKEHTVIVNDDGCEVIT